MKKSFTWENFDIGFIKSIAYSERTRAAHRPRFDTDDKLSLLPTMDRICSIPDHHFVRFYRNEIMDYFLNGSTHLVSIVSALEKHRYRGIHMGSMEDMLANLKRLRLTDTVLKLILIELNRRGQRFDEEDEYSIFTYPKSIDMSTSIANELPLYDFQKEAIVKLKEHFVDSDQRSGILVMPTGSGKTRVATRFLLQDMVGIGYQVVWLSHRAMLIEQTADTVYNAAPIIKFTNPKKEQFKMVCVSGQHATIRSLESDDDVMIFSVQTLCRNLPYLQAMLSAKVLIIVDEAHHTLAPSYRLIIEKIKALRPSAKLLGLTATPDRITDSDTARLMRLFDNKIIYSVAMSKLIADGTLAEPHFVRIDTNVDYCRTMTLDDKAYINKWGEISPEVSERMAKTVERNELIVRTYMERQTEYGKTLIFALNATHCISLCEELQKHGVRCDYIYCAHSGNDEKISRFKKGELDVLVNINVMTEGSDVPDIQTVFLTRPTSSDVLLMQMIGRGMRGPGCKGTKTVNIVDFHDVWGSFTNWLNPKFVIGVETVPPPEKEPATYHKQETVPWAKIRDLLDLFNCSIVGSLSQKIAIPSAWYDVFDEDGNDMKILLFESQLSGFTAMWKDKNTLINDPSFDAEAAIEKYFGDFGLMPNVRDVQLLIDFYRLAREMPHPYAITGRKAIEPSLVVKRLKENDIRLSEVDLEISRLYTENSDIIDSLYGNEENYKSRVLDFLAYPDGIRPLGTRIDELPWEFLALDRTPAYHLETLVNEVLHEMFHDDYGEVPPIRWTDIPYTTYFGKYSYPSDGAKGQDRIRINCVLDSKDVPREVVKYIMYHELLHRDNRIHDQAFRVLEHRYPNWVEHERFLDFTFPKFALEYAL